MPLNRNIKLNTVIEKNKIASNVAFIVTLHIKVKNTAGVVIENLYIVNNNEDLTIKTQLEDLSFVNKEYMAYPFSLDYEEIEGGISEVKINFQDITKTIQQQMQSYNGGIGSSVILSIFNSSDLNNGADMSEEFDITAASADDYSVTFTLGVANPLANQFPKRVYLRKDFPLLGKSNLGY